MLKNSHASGWLYFGVDSTPFEHAMALDLWWALDYFSGPNPHSVTAVKLPHAPDSQRKQTWVQKNLSNWSKFENATCGLASYSEIHLVTCASASPPKGDRIYMQPEIVRIQTQGIKVSKYVLCLFFNSDLWI